MGVIRLEPKIRIETSILKGYESISALSDYKNQNNDYKNKKNDFIALTNVNKNGIIELL